MWAIPVHVPPAAVAELDHPLPLAWQRATRCGRTGRDRAEVGYRLRAEKAARQRGTLDAFRARRSRLALVIYAEETNLTAGNTLARELRLSADTVTPFRLYPASGALSYDSARAVIARNPSAVFATSVRFIAGRGIISMPDSLAKLILATDRQRPTLLVSFGSPYLLSQLPGYAGSYLLAWSDAPATERGVARALSAGAPITGKLPITLGPKYPRDYGITIGGSEGGTR